MRRRECSRGGRRDPRPTWWLLYATAALLLAVVGLVQVFVAGEGLRSVLTVLAVVGGFWLMALWLRRNRIALDLERGRRA